MKIAFNSPGRKRLIAGLVLAFMLIYLGLATREFVAWWLETRNQLASLKAAAWLDPGNADYRNHVGRYYDVQAHDPVAAIGQYKRAVQLNPYSAEYWFDLASAYQVLADSAGQASALDRAIQAEPTKPDVAWTAANFFLVRGDNQKALREFRVVMANDPSLAASAIAFCWRINPDVDLLLRDAVPPTADAEIAFLTLLQKDVALHLAKVLKPDDDTDVASLTQQIKEEAASSFKVWNALIETHQPFEERYAYDYIRFLLQYKEIDQAVLVWQQFAERFARSSYLPSESNLVVNGTFSLGVLNNGFDWQYDKQPGVELKFDDTTAHGGSRSFRITFDGPGISEAGIHQFIPVQASTTYDFSAYYKNEQNAELEGAGGPHFTIQDMFSSAILYESDELRGAESWMRSEGEFTTGPDCRLVKLLVRRLPEGYPIRGKLWIDDFHLAHKPAQASSPGK
jgi:tetratricopeptide (TPR) repeat protein